MLEKTYQPSELERRIYDAWEQADAFACGRPERADAKPYTIVIPPPNVTGSLHMGHALNNTLQDVLARFERMRGRDVLWQPGMDHAGIATQMVVERQLMERQEPDRHAMGRKRFVERVWEWKEESGGLILNQLKRLGASCDWRRSRFTMDEGLSKAVLKVFVDLYRQGLIYKDMRLVNWDPKLLTAISDLEVQQVETKGHLWHFRYPLKDEKDRFVVVATTRPETMLGDTAVAVHPEDERYTDIVGKTVVLPLVGREIPIIADEYADPEQGSGAVKITPAHDFNDFEVGRRHGLEMVNIFRPDGHLKSSGHDDFTFGHRAPGAEGSSATLADEDSYGEPTYIRIPEPLRGLDRFEARDAIVAMMETRGLVEKIEDYAHTLPYGDRSSVVIEPFLTEQWYVNAKTLAEPAIEAVEMGETVFIPRNWEKTYFEWMRNIQPWCISRQLWWGHQIPAWYGPDREIFVAESEGEAIELAARHYEAERGERKVSGFSPETFGNEYAAGLRSGDFVLEQDEDVLDTWFSSALWPFSTLGWPDETPELKRHYKTDVLVTGFDIIFFWVARMMMMGLHFMKDETGRPEVPFHTVYIHALVRDAHGQKMSKSKGNVMDPLELADEFGADALRFTLAAMAAQGRDIKLARSRVEGYRNFGTKIWNAGRFLEMNGCAPAPGFDPASAGHTVNRWIAGEVEKTAAAVTENIEAYRFNDAASAIYHFVWHIYCDWYVELIKPLLAGDDEAVAAETRATAAWAFDQALKLLHPFMPFLTEELWARLGESGQGRDAMLILAEWPQPSGLVDEQADRELDWVIRFVSEVRSVRSEMNVPAGTRIPVVVMNAGDRTAAWAERYAETIRRLARLERIDAGAEAPKGSVQIVLDEATLALPLEGVIDITGETERLRREIDKVGSEIDKLESRLADETFIARAPEHVVEEQRERKADAEATANKLRDALKRLETAV